MGRLATPHSPARLATQPEGGIRSTWKSSSAQRSQLALIFPKPSADPSCRFMVKLCASSFKLMKTPGQTQPKSSAGGKPPFSCRVYYFTRSGKRVLGEMPSTDGGSSYFGRATSPLFFARPMQAVPAHVPGKLLIISLTTTKSGRKRPNSSNKVSSVVLQSC